MMKVTIKVMKATITMMKMNKTVNGNKSKKLTTINTTINDDENNNLLRP